MIMPRVSLTIARKSASDGRPVNNPGQRHRSTARFSPDSLESFLTPLQLEEPFHIVNDDIQSRNQDQSDRGGDKNPKPQ